MEPHEILFQPSVEKDLRKMSAENCDRVMVRIETLANDPFPAQVVKLKGTEGLPLTHPSTHPLALLEHLS